MPQRNQSIPRLGYMKRLRLPSAAKKTPSGLKRVRLPKSSEASVRSATNLALKHGFTVQNICMWVTSQGRKQRRCPSLATRFCRLLHRHELTCVHTPAFLDKLQKLLELATAAALGGQVRSPVQIEWKKIGRRVLRIGRSKQRLLAMGLG